MKGTLQDSTTPSTTPSDSFFGPIQNMRPPRLQSGEVPSSGTPHTRASETMLGALDTTVPKTSDMNTNSGGLSLLRRDSGIPGSRPLLAVTQTYTTRKRKDAVLLDALQDVQKQKAPRIPVHKKIPVAQQAPVPIDVKNEVPILSLEAERHVLATTPRWLGATNVPQGCTSEMQPHAIFDPIPVRIPVKIVSQLSNRPSSSAAADSLVGLAIHSYVLSGRRELIYVILLDDGQELHIPSGQVEPIMLTVDSTSDHKRGADSFIDGLHLPGHPSSEKVDHVAADSADTTAFSTHPSWIASRYWGTFSNNSHSCSQLKLALSDLDLTLSEFGAPVNSFPPSVNSEQLEQSAHTLEASDERPSQRSQMQEESQSVALSVPAKSIARPSFSALFQDVVMNHATQLGRALHPTELMRRRPCTLASTSTKTPVHHRMRNEVSHDAPVKKGNASPAMAPTTTPSADAFVDKCGATIKRAPTPAVMVQPPLQPPLGFGVYSRRCSRGSAAVAPVIPGRAMKQPACTATGQGGAGASGRSDIAGLRRGRPTINGSVRASRASKAAEAAAFAAAYGEETWRTEHTTYVHDRVIFTGPTPGPNFRTRRMPCKQSLFGRFWTEKTLEKICEETNRYASEVDPETSLQMGGPRWWGLSPTELRAFMGISLMMGIKRLPNHRAYWSKRFPFLHCQTIATTMSQSRYEDITRCLHVSEDTNVDEEGSNNVSDKLAKLGWLLAEMRRRFKQYWQLHQEVTIDESMVRYKGHYCPIRQYLPKKPTKWGIKVWCLADAHKYYVYDFSVYTGSTQRPEAGGSVRGAGKSGYEVVMFLMAGLHGRGHVVVTDNFFTSVKLIVDLATLGTYAAGTVNSNRVGLPKALAQKKLFVNEPRETLAWLMHSSRQIACVVWVDRQPVLLLSSFYTPLPRLGEAWPTVPRWIAGEEQLIATSPVHKGYTKYMRGVDVADQMRGAYSSQVRSHKWWHRLFFFLLDTSVVNSYIIYKDICERLVQNPIERVDFQLLLAEALCRPWMLRRGCVSRFRLAQPAVHSLVRTSSRKKCRFCFSSTRTNLCCLQCAGVHLHMGECFRRTHYSLRR